MKGIAIFGGTTEGRQLVKNLQNAGLKLHICVATEYGASLLPETDNIKIYPKRLNELEMEQFLKETGVDCCVDATHPYASEVTKNLVQACENADVFYIRILREEGILAEEKKSDVVYVSDVAEAAEYLSKTSGNIFIATGSKELEKYTVIPDFHSRCVARVLPTLPVMEKCREIGFEGKNLIGMQGPFTEEMNYCMLKQANADWLVTKNSGSAGGYIEKCEAALRLGVRILVVGRPAEQEKNGMSLGETIQFLHKRYEVANPGDRKEKNFLRMKEKKTLYLVAMGPGNDKLLTGEAVEILEQADVLIGARRILEIWKPYQEKPHFISYKQDEIMAYLQEHPEYKKVAVCYSGDIGFYSGARGMWKTEQLQSEWEIRGVSGISSVTYFLNKIGIPWDEVELVSCHGKETDLISILEKKKKVCTLLGNQDAVDAISRQLLEHEMSQVKMTVGERLSYPDEQIVEGMPEQLLNQEFDSLSVLVLEL